MKQMPVAEVFRVFEPEDPESRANNALVVRYGRAEEEEEEEEREREREKE